MLLAASSALERPRLQDRAGLPEYIAQLGDVDLLRRDASLNAERGRRARGLASDHAGRNLFGRVVGAMVDRDAAPRRQQVVDLAHEQRAIRNPVAGAVARPVAGDADRVVHRTVDVLAPE